MWKVTVAVMRIETREVCADSADEAKEIAEREDGGRTVSALSAEWIDAEG